MKDALIIALIVLVLIISGIIVVAANAGDIPIYATVCLFLFVAVFCWFTLSRITRSRNPSHQEEFPRGKLSLEDSNRWSEKQLKLVAKFWFLPLLIVFLMAMILAIVMAVTSH